LTSKILQVHANLQLGKYGASTYNFLGDMKYNGSVIHHDFPRFRYTFNF